MLFVNGHRQITLLASLGRFHGTVQRIPGLRFRSQRLIRFQAFHGFIRCADQLANDFVFGHTICPLHAASFTAFGLGLGRKSSLNSSSEYQGKLLSGYEW